MIWDRYDKKKKPAANERRTGRRWPKFSNLRMFDGASRSRANERRWTQDEGGGVGERGKKGGESSVRFCIVVSARRHAVSAELIGAGNEVRDRGILITESNQFHETHEALATPRSLKEQSSYGSPLAHPRHLLIQPHWRSNQMHRIKLI